MKKLTVILALLFIFGHTAFGQYLETFSIPNKGLLGGPCGADAFSCAAIDFSGVNWTVNGNLSGFDADDLFATNTSGVLFVGGDVDEEICFESPFIDISSVIGGADIAVDLVWTHHDASDYIDVEYMVNESGTWVQIPNQFGGGSHTVDFTSSGNTGSGTINQGGLVGSSLFVRVCVDSNTSSSGESATIDNVSVPNPGASLPVKWDDVSVSKTQRGNLIEWSTANEINNESFEIQKRNDNDTEFYTIEEVEGQGTTFRKTEYSYLDRDIKGGNVYYRIKQNDLDGHFTYSEIMSLNNEKERSLMAFPNPFQDKINLSFDNVQNKPFDIQIYDSFGRLIFERLNANSENTTIETSDFASGVYYLKNTLNNKSHLLIKE